MMERLSLWFRTFRYQYKNDIGGMNFIKSSLKRGDTVFDIGAHKGGYLNLMRRCTGKQGTVIGFEPQFVLFEYLNSITKSLNWSNVKIEHMALSDKEGTSYIHIPVNKVKQGSSPGASLLNMHPKNEIIRTEEVNVQTLDNYINQTHLKPTFLKIDVEGNELNIFKGGKIYLGAAKPKILVEIEARHVGEEQVMETIVFLREMNYSGKFIHKKELVDLGKFTFAKYQNTKNMGDYCNNFIFE